MNLFYRPTVYMFALWGMILAAGGFTVWLALQPPWLGVRFAPLDSGSGVVVADVFDERADIPHGALVQGLKGRDGIRLELQPTDLMDEPDVLDTYAQMNTFFARQSALNAILHSGETRLLWQTKDGTPGESTLQPGQRPLADLPVAFWFQLLTGLLCFFIASWIFVLRPQDWGARMFLLTGLALSISIFPAAIYSSRELALPETLFRLLSATNHFGATAFGMALVALFACYPQRLFPLRYLWLLPLIFIPWTIADSLQWMPDTHWGAHYPLIIELLLAISCAVLQWRRSRSHPLDRAALRWFSFSVLVGCCLFILISILPSTLGLPPLMSQGYSFGFFLVMYAGIALGLRKYRLFDLNELAYRILLWIAGAVAVVALDLLLLLAGVTQAWSLGVSLFIAGGLYFPLRQWLWQRMMNRSGGKLETILPHLSRLSFIATQAEQENEWDGLLQRLFDPLEIRRETGNCKEARVLEGGLALCIPAAGSLTQRQLRLAAMGQRLFSTQDARFATVLGQLAEQLMSGRMQFEQGIRQERLRLSRDLHDNLGARLLRLIHHLQGRPEAQIARDAIKELRTSLAAMDAPNAPLRDVLADWRSETEGRCAAAQVPLVWQQGDIPSVMIQARTRAGLGAILRELISNALKHATPSRIEVVVGVSDEALHMKVSNDGCYLPPDAWQEGFGLRNLRARSQALGAALDLTGQDHAVQAQLTIPLHGNVA